MPRGRSERHEPSRRHSREWSNPPPSPDADGPRRHRSVSDAEKRHKEAKEAKEAAEKVRKPPPRLAQRIIECAMEDDSEELGDLIEDWHSHPVLDTKNSECDETALWIAARNGFVNTASVLAAAGADLNAKNKFGETPAYIAACYGHKDVLALLLKCGCDYLTIRDKRGELPYHIACYYNHIDCVELLLDHGTPVNICDKDGRTGAYICAYHDHHEILSLLIKRGADLDLGRSNGRTPVYVAGNETNPVCLCMLLEFGAKVNTKDKHGRTALAASTNEEIKKILRAHGGTV